MESLKGHFLGLQTLYWVSILNIHYTFSAYQLKADCEQTLMSLTRLLRLSSFQTYVDLIETKNSVLKLRIPPH